MIPPSTSGFAQTVAENSRLGRSIFAQCQSGDRLALTRVRGFSKPLRFHRDPSPVGRPGMSPFRPPAFSFFRSKPMNQQGFAGNGSLEKRYWISVFKYGAMPLRSLDPKQEGKACTCSERVSQFSPCACVRPVVTLWVNKRCLARAPEVRLRWQPTAISSRVRPSGLRATSPIAESIHHAASTARSVVLRIRTAGTWRPRGPFSCARPGLSGGCQSFTRKGQQCSTRS